jgi:hypothetical protein
MQRPNTSIPIELLRQPSSSIPLELVRPGPAQLLHPHLPPPPNSDQVATTYPDHDLPRPGAQARICLDHDLLAQVLLGSSPTTVSLPRCSWALLDKQVLAEVLLGSTSGPQVLRPAAAPLPVSELSQSLSCPGTSPSQDHQQEWLNQF